MTWRYLISTPGALDWPLVRRPCSMRSTYCDRPILKTSTPLPGRTGNRQAIARCGKEPSATGWPMRRGEVRLAALDPVRGSEANKRRPSVVVSNDRANAAAERLGRGIVTVVPITSNVVRVFPFQVLLPAEMSGLQIDSKAQRSRCVQLPSSVSAHRWVGFR